MFVRTDKDIFEVNPEDSRFVFGGGGYLFIKELTTVGPTGYHSSERNLGKIISMNKDILNLCDGFYIDDGSKQFKKDHIFETAIEFENAYRRARVADTYAVGYGFILNNSGLVFIDISDYLRRI